MLPRADFVIYDRDGHPSVAVEVKRKLGTTRRWAAEFHRNLLAHGNGGAVDYFTIVTPDRLYVWDEADETGAAPDPTFEIAAEPAFASYFRGTGLSPESIDGQAFEMIVAAWLRDLVNPFDAPNGTRATGGMEALSGLFNRVRGGRVEPEPAPQ
jgi:hypothetical protein